MGSSEERAMVTRAIHNDGGRAGEIFLVHQISGMIRAEARPFMQDYFAAGGDMKAAAGTVLWRHRTKDDGTAGVVVDAVEGAAKWVVDTVKDAMVNAGRALGEFIGEVVLPNLIAWIDIKVFK